MRAPNRRGMSPLIATVLLMAFAVALGGMIMNWQGTFTNTKCEDIVIESRLCYDDQSIKVTARNTGEETVPRLRLMIDGLEVIVPNSLLNEGEDLEERIPVLISNDVSVNLHADIESNIGYEMCPVPLKSHKPMPKC